MNPSLVERARRAVCAIGYSKVDPATSLDGLQPNFEILGTGFLVRPGQVMTCAHVLDELEHEMRRKKIPPEQRFAQFVYGVDAKTWTTDYRPFTVHKRLDEPDLALLKVQGVHASVEPIAVVGPDSPPAAIGEEVAVCGYAHGSILLTQGKKKIDRFGPLLLRGSIAALSPYDVPTPQSLLLDLVTAPCASGSPVLRVRDGEVLAVVVAGQKGRTAVVSVASTIVKDRRGNLVARIATPREKK